MIIRATVKLQQTESMGPIMNQTVQRNKTHDHIISLFQSLQVWLGMFSHSGSCVCCQIARATNAKTMRKPCGSKGARCLVCEDRVSTAENQALGSEKAQSSGNQVTVLHMSSVTKMDHGTVLRGI